MRKLHVVLSLILSLCFIFTGCDLDFADDTISVSGDLAYYAEMDKDTLEEKCKGNYIEVSGTVYSIYKNVGTIYLGNRISDKLYFSCSLSNSDDAMNIEKGDLVIIRGKCSSCLSSTIYLQNCTVAKYTNQTELESTAPSSETLSTSSLEPTSTPTTESTTESTTEPTAKPTTKPTSKPTVKPTNPTESTTAPTTPPATEAAPTPTTPPATEPAHVHKFSAATCTSPKTCSCGSTEGKAKGHDWKDATCSSPKTCKSCGTTSGLTAGHNFSKGKCTTCGKEDPDYNHETMVWIPTKGGTKYHSRPGCSNMDDPKEVTQSKAESLGFTPCKRCH